MPVLTQDTRMDLLMTLLANVYQVLDEASSEVTEQVEELRKHVDDEGWLILLSIEEIESASQQKAVEMSYLLGLQHQHVTLAELLARETPLAEEA